MKNPIKLRQILITPKFLTLIAKQIFYLISLNTDIELKIFNTKIVYLLLPVIYFGERFVENLFHLLNGASSPILFCTLHCFTPPYLTE